MLDAQNIQKGKWLGIFHRLSNGDYLMVIIFGFFFSFFFMWTHKGKLLKLQRLAI